MMDCSPHELPPLEPGGQQTPLPEQRHLVDTRADKLAGNSSVIIGEHFGGIGVIRGKASEDETVSCVAAV